MTGATRTGAVVHDILRDEKLAPPSGAGGALARRQVEQALAALLGTPVALTLAKNHCQLSLEFATFDELEALLRNLLSARVRDASGLAAPVARATPSDPGVRDLRLVTTTEPDEALAARRRRSRNQSRNVSAYGPRPNPIRQQP